MSLHQPTRVLVVGGGGREHAIAWKLAQEPGGNEIVVAPGSAAIAREPRVRCVPVEPLDPQAVVECARAASVELVVVGPEAPLSVGVADALEAAGIPVFGPTRAAAALETSKAFCHEVAEAAGVRMARAKAFAGGDAAGALAFIEALAADGAGVVLKADGLAAGKGVIVCDSIDQARELAPSFVEGRPADEPALVIEERLFGPEASVIAICDGTRVVALPAARDHKRLCDGDEGPEHRRHGRLLAAARPRRRGGRARARDRAPADPRRARPPRHAVPRLPVRGPDPHRRRAGAPRVQRPAGRSRGAGDPAAARRRARPAAARGGARRAPGDDADRCSRRARSPPSASCSRRRATRATRAAATRSRASTTRRPWARSSSMPARSSDRTAGSARTGAAS